jgi:hypothetical protein
MRVRCCGTGVPIALVVAALAAAPAVAAGAAALPGAPAAGELAPAGGVRSLRGDVRVEHVMDLGVAPHSLRVVKAPDDRLYVLQGNGDILRIDPAARTRAIAYTRAQHGLANPAGLAIGPSGTMYVVGNDDGPGDTTRATVVKGEPGPGGARTWSVLARTAPYPKGNTPFDHRFNGIAADPAGRYVYVNSGARTDHGEVESAQGRFPGLREAGITACVLRLPATATGLSLPDDRGQLRRAGYLFADGTRNSYDLAFAPNGALFAPDNGPDRDMSDELNWLRRGRHYGFPWRIGGSANPQQLPTYDPAADRLLDPRFYAVSHGLYHRDPTFPDPGRLRFTEPVINVGPDADSFRDPVDGKVYDASALGRSLRSFTAHRAPLGLAFDVAGAMGDGFDRSGFMLSWTRGDPAGESVAGPFHDAGQDLIALRLRKLHGLGYVTRATRLVEGFGNPIDAEVVGNAVYVVEYGGRGGLWRIVVPPAACTGNAGAGARAAAGPHARCGDGSGEGGIRTLGRG